MSVRLQELQTGKILLIESNSGVRVALHKLLEAYGLSVTSHKTGEQGISTTLRHNYNMVICNQRLAGISGLDFFAKVQPFLAHSTTVLTASFGDESLYRKAQNLGINIFMEKPFKVENLIKCIANPGIRDSKRIHSEHLHITNSGRIISIYPPENASISVPNEVRHISNHKSIERRGRKWEIYYNHGNFTSTNGQWDSSPYIDFESRTKSI